MENEPVSIKVIHSRRHWKKAYFTMRGYAFILAVTSTLFAIGFAYAILK